MKKNVVITGSSRGIGFELTKEFLKNGHNVLAISRNLNAMEALKKFDEKGKLILKKLDLSEYEKVKEIVKEIDQWNSVDVLYNNAGLLINKEFANLSVSDFQNCWNVNFLGPAILIQSLLPKMKEGSNIVNISTMGAVQGSIKFPGLSAYSSSKAALTNLSEILAEELKEKNIHINTMCLGAVQTEMLEEAFPDFKAQVQPIEMAKYLFNFGMNDYKLYNGKILQVSCTTP